MFFWTSSVSTPLPASPRSCNYLHKYQGLWLVGLQKYSLSNLHYFQQFENLLGGITEEIGEKKKIAWGEPWRRGRYWTSARQLTKHNVVKSEPLVPALLLCVVHHISTPGMVPVLFYCPRGHFTSWLPLFSLPSIIYMGRMEGGEPLWAINVNEGNNQMMNPRTSFAEVSLRELLGISHVAEMNERAAGAHHSSGTAGSGTNLHKAAPSTAWPTWAHAGWL